MGFERTYSKQVREKGTKLMESLGRFFFSSGFFCAGIFVGMGLIGGEFMVNHFGISLSMGLIGGIMSHWGRSKNEKRN